MCGNYSREETVQGRKLYEEIWYVYYMELIRKHFEKTDSIE